MSLEAKKYQGNGQLILGIVLLVLTFWMFAQSMQVALIPSIARHFGITNDPGQMDLLNFAAAIYATPSTYTAVSAVPQEKAAVAAGIYKLASSLGGAIGVALSLAVFSAPENVHEAGAMGLWLNIGFGVLALLSILFIIPKQPGAMNKVTNVPNMVETEGLPG